MKASFKVGDQDVTADMLVIWKDISKPEGNDIEITELTLTSAVVDGKQLSKDELLTFRSTHETSCREILEWIALSSIDSVETSAC
jgi:hypothetical protein